MIARSLWIIFVALIVLLPLPLGSYNPWTWSVTGVAIAIIVLGWSATRLTTTDATVAWRSALWPPMAMFVAVILWVLFQMSPFGPAHPVWDLASAALHERLTGSMSVAPQLSKIALIRLLSFGGAFWIALQYGRDRERAYMLLRWFVYGAGAYALYGLINFIAGNKYLLWYRRNAYLDDVTGTFVNHNTYATYAGIALIAIVGLLIQTLRRTWQMTDPTLPAPERAIEALNGKSAIYLITGLIVAMAWLQSHSRMGFIATLIGLTAFMLIGRTLALRGKLIGIAVGAVLLVPLLSWSGGGLMERLDKTGSNDRMPIFTLAARAVETAPLFGHGYGSFGAVLPMYRDGSLPADKVFSLAHDTYLELALEIGIPVAALLTFCVAWLAALCLIGAYKRNRDGVIPAIAFATAVLVGVHALLDFSVQMPAVGCLFAALLGIGNAQAWPTIQKPARRRPDADPAP